VPEAIVAPPIEVPIDIPRIPIIPPMAPPAMINAAIDQNITTINNTIQPSNTPAVEPALAPAVEPTLEAIGPTTLHPIQPVPRSLPHPICTLKPNRRTKYNSWFCYTPERQIIPNAVVPAIMPKGISDFHYKYNQNTRNAFFQVCYDNTCIRYLYGPNGYTRENAYMEAARCLRYFFIRSISKLDDTMDINHDMYDTLDHLLSEDDGLGVPMERTLSLATTNSATTSSRGLVFQFHPPATRPLTTPIILGKEKVYILTFFVR
jgi:hypothetical protein